MSINSTGSESLRVLKRYLYLYKARTGKECPSAKFPIFWQHFVIVLRRIMIKHRANEEEMIEACEQMFREAKYVLSPAKIEYWLTLSRTKSGDSQR